MADVNMPKFVPCKFDEKGCAPCKKPSTNGWCSKHEKVKCVSCGKHAVRSCDAEMGGLCCGSPLCKTCQHDFGGVSHVNAKVYADQIKERREFEQTGQESKRVLEKRGVPTGLPRHLKDLLEGDRTGWTSRACYALEIKHGLMGFFPAIVRETKIMVVVPDKELIFRVWKSLDPRDSKIISRECMVNESGTVAYSMQLGSDFDKIQSRPLKLFKASEIEELFAKDATPFAWAPGLFFDTEIGKEEFGVLVNRARKALRVA